SPRATPRASSAEATARTFSITSGKRMSSSTPGFEIRWKTTAPGSRTYASKKSPLSVDSGMGVGLASYVRLTGGPACGGTASAGRRESGSGRASGRTDVERDPRVERVEHAAVLVAREVDGALDAVRVLGRRSAQVADHVDAQVPARGLRGPLAHHLD